MVCVERQNTCCESALISEVTKHNTECVGSIIHAVKSMPLSQKVVDII